MLPLAQRATQYTAYAALRVVIATIQALPLSACERCATGLGWLFDDALRFRRKLVDENLRTAFPNWSDGQRRTAASRMWRHLFLMVTEIAHAPRKVSRTTWRRLCSIEGERLIVSTLLRDGPKVIISGHYGNFELGGYLLGLFGMPTHTIARALDNPYVDRYVNDFRGRTGQHILPKSGSREAVERLLDGGGVLTLLGDQHAGPKGCWVEFFGKRASTHKAVSLFTLSYRAPTLVISVQRTGGPLRYRVSAIDAVDPAEKDFSMGTTTLMTEWFTDGLETAIRRDPTQYWWVHRRWKGEPPNRRRRQRADPPHSASSTAPGETPRNQPDHATPARAAG